METLKSCNWKQQAATQYQMQQLFFSLLFLALAIQFITLL